MDRRTVLKFGATLPLAAIPLVNAKAFSYEGAEQNPSVMKIQRLDWAGIKIEVGKTTLFIDATSYPNQNDMKLSAGTDYKHAVITHHHSDHYDPAALKTIFDSNSLLVCHSKVLPWLDIRDLRTQTVKLHEPIAFSRWTGEITAIPVPAVDGFGHPQVSWVIYGGGKKIIHCGDTLWHGYWHDIAAYGPFDMAFMPINGARMNQGRVYDTGIPAVLTPHQAVIASKLLNAKVVCPIHYGRASENYFETPDPEGKFLRSAQENKCKTVVLKIGSWVQWEQ